MDNKPVTPDNNRDEFDDVLEIMRKRRTRPEYPATAAKPSANSSKGKNQLISNNGGIGNKVSAENDSSASQDSILKGSLANTVIISVDNNGDKASAKDKAAETPSADKTMVHDAVKPAANNISPEHSTTPAKAENIPADAVKSTPKTPSDESLAKTTVQDTVPVNKASVSNIKPGENNPDRTVPETTNKTVEVTTPPISRQVSNETKININPVKKKVPPVTPPEKPKKPEKPVHHTETSAISLDDFSSTTSSKKISYDDSKVKVTFLGSVWFGIIKIILYLVFVLTISSAIAASVIYIANDIFAFVKEAEIVAQIPVNSNSIEITSILNKSNILNENNETELTVEVLKNNSVKLADTLNKTDTLKPLKDAGITKITINDNTSFTITVPAGVDVSVIADFLDTVNAKEIKTDLQIVINIPENATTNDVGKILKEAGVIKYSGIFNMYANYRIDKRWYLNGEYIPGEHIVNPMMNYDKLLDELSVYERDVSGTVRITIPEGLTVNETLDLLVKKGVGKKEDYNEALQSFAYEYPFVTELTADKISAHRFNTDISYRLEGYLFPDTYDFYYNENPISVLDKFLTNFNKKFEEEYYTRASALGLSIDEIITLASMIEKEGNNPEDYYYISSVFHNRLNSSEYPYLNSDATLQYALSERSDAYNIDTSMEHPYNTYNNRGLPPGAICNPGIQAIDAALYPEKTNYYYFYTKKNGETVFTRTYDEHLAVVNADKAN